MPVTALLRKLVSVLSLPTGDGIAEVAVEEVPCAGMDRPRALFEIDCEIRGKLFDNKRVLLYSYTVRL
jgi:hypothetical protein